MKPVPISLVTPSFNQARFIEETLKSVVAQHHSKLEWFVYDGGSEDGAVAVIERYESWMDGWASEPDRGQSHAINKGLDRAHGEWVGWLNSDDVLLPGALEAWSRAATLNPEAAVLVGGVRNVDEGGRTLSEYHAQNLDLEHIARWNAPGGTFITQPSCLIRRSALLEAGPLREDLHYTMDVDLWLRLARIGPFVSLPEVIATNRIYADAKTYRDVLPRIIEHTGVLFGHGFRAEAEAFLAHNLPELIGTLADPVDVLSRVPVSSFVKATLRKVTRRAGGGST
jgi:GT2 family glycosyltransferase